MRFPNDGRWIFSVAEPASNNGAMVWPDHTWRVGKNGDFNRSL